MRRRRSVQENIDLQRPFTQHQLSRLPGFPPVKISKSVLSYFGQEASFLDDIAVGIYDRFLDIDDVKFGQVNPKDGTQLMIEFRKGQDQPLTTFAVFHDGEFWVGCRPFVADVSPSAFPQLQDFIAIDARAGRAKNSSSASASMNCRCRRMSA